MDQPSYFIHNPTHVWLVRSFCFLLRMRGDENLNKNYIWKKKKTSPADINQQIVQNTYNKKISEQSHRHASTACKKSLRVCCSLRTLVGVSTFDNLKENSKIPIQIQKWSTFCHCIWISGPRCCAGISMAIFKQDWREDIFMSIHEQIS